MKKIYCLFILIVFTSGRAQTITQSFNEPVIGDMDKNYRLDTSAFTSGLPLNVTGNNCTWDFSGLTGSFPIVVDSFIAPSAAPNSTAFIGTSYVQHRDPLYTYYKSTTSPQQTELLGATSPSLSLTFTNSAIIASYPINYGYNLVDPVGGTFKYNTNNGVCIGSITISSDGLGTVKLPNNTSVTNVLRLKSVEQLTLSVNIFPFGTFNQTIYNYYKPGKKYPILSINYTTYALITGTPVTTAYIYGSDNYFTVAGINNASLDAADYSVFPNPFHEQLFTRPKTMTELVTYSFYDLETRLVLKTNALNEEALKKLIPGMYFLKSETRQGNFYQKLIKE